MRKKLPLTVYLAFFLVGGVAFYFIWLSPYMTDNFVFSRALSPGYARFYAGENVTAQPLTIATAFSQAVEMYRTWCGRFTGNLAVYLLFMLPRGLYAVLAALAFSFYALALCACVFGRHWRERLSPEWILGVAALLWAGIPSFGEAFLWLSVGGAIALLGQALIFLPFRFALDKRPAKHPLTLAFFLKCLAFFLGAVAAASLDYPTSAALPVTGIACVLWLYFSGKKALRVIPVLPLCGAAGLVIGALITLGAPGNMERLRITNDPNVLAYLDASWLERIGGWLSHLPAALLMDWPQLILLAWGLFVIWRRYRKGWWKRVPIAASLFLLPAALTFGAYLFTPWPPPRAFATSSAQLIVAACVIFAFAQEKATRREWTRFRLLRAAFVLYCVVLIGAEAQKFYRLSEITDERSRILENASGDSASLPRLPVNSGDRYWVLGKYLHDISEDSSFWVNRAVALHYGLKEVSLANPPRANFRFSSDAPNHESEDSPITRNLRINFRNNRVNVDLPVAQARDLEALHVYYYGAPAALSYLPKFAANFLFRWLAEAPPDSIRSRFVPILLARTDINLVPGEASDVVGHSPPLKIYSLDRVWLVKPGESRYSFEIFPLESEKDSLSPPRDDI